MEKYKFRLELQGMTCAGCVGTIERGLLASQQVVVNKANVNLIAECGFLSVEAESTQVHEIPQLLKDQVEALGYECSQVLSYDDDILPPLVTESPLDRKRQRKKRIRSHLLKGFFGTLLGVGLLALSLTGVGLPLALSIGLTVFSSAATLWLGYPMYKDAWKKWTRARSLNMNSLFSISTLVVMAVSVLSFVVPGLSLILEAGLLIFGFRHLGLVLEYMLETIIYEPAAFRSLASHVTKIHPDGREEAGISPAALVAGDRIRVSKGQVIPLDGVVESETALVDDSLISLITGMTSYTQKKRGETLYAGLSVGQDEDLIMVVMKSEQHSYLAHLDQQMQLIQAEKSPLQKQIDVMTRYFIPAVIVFSMVAGIVIGVLFNPILAVQCAVSVLLSLCPCILGYIAPRSLYIGVKKAADHGVECKNADSLEAAAKVNALMFDINGTLTKGTPQLVGWFPLEEKLENDLWDEIISLEEGNTHPLGQVISQFAMTRKQANMKHGRMIPQKNTKHHAGIQGKNAANNLLIGNAKYLKEHDIVAPDTLQHEASADDQINFVVKNGKVIGYFVARDEVRPEVPEVLSYAEKQGYALYLCSGLPQEIAEFYGEKWGIPKDRIWGDAAGDTSLPNNKCARIKALQAEGKIVAMVADGGNDALSMPQSDCGIAVRSPFDNAITRHHAQMVIRTDSLLPVLTGLEIAKKTVRNTKISLGVSLTYNLTTLLIAGGILLAIGFALNPAIGVALMIVQACLVLYLQKRFMQEKLRCIEKIKPQTAVVDEQDGSYQCFKKLGLCVQSDKLKLQKASSMVDQEKALLVSGTRIKSQEPLSSPLIREDSYKPQRCLG